MFKWTTVRIPLNINRNKQVIQGDSVARGPKLLSINSLGPLATESPCITYQSVYHASVKYVHLKLRFETQHITRYTLVPGRHKIYENLY